MSKVLLCVLLEVPVAGTPVMRSPVRGRRSAIGATRTRTRCAVVAMNAVPPAERFGRRRVRLCAVYELAFLFALVSFDSTEILITTQ